MTIISYAQNFEDVMLWRALGHIDKGFYIDVGANDPVVDSVTKAFYDAGWRGINIEPVPQWFAKIEADRPRDINLNIAAGSSQGTLTFYEIPDTGLSTFDEQTALRHHQEREFDINKKNIEVTTLTQICNAYHVAPVHFLKIDVEGHEKDVLMGLDLEAIRPWIIVVEATAPLSQKQDHEHWEQLITDKHYEHVYFDGLNRYYVAHEKKELTAYFNAPPNVFDDFQLSGMASNPFCHHVKNTLNQQINSIEAKCEQHGQWLQSEWDVTKAVLEQQQQHSQWLQSEWDAAKAALKKQEQHGQWLQSEWVAAKAVLEQQEQQGQWLQSEWDAAKTALEQQHQHDQWLQSEWDAAKDKINELHHSSHHWWMVAEARQQQIDALLISTSWRITWPLRQFKLAIRWIILLPVRFIKALLRPFLTVAIKSALKRQGFRERLSRRLQKWPKVYAHLKQFARHRGIIDGSSSVLLSVMPTAHEATHEIVPKVTELATDSVSDVTPQANAALESLSPRARQIYHDLKAAIDQRQKEQH